MIFPVGAPSATKLAGPAVNWAPPTRLVRYCRRREAALLERYGDDREARQLLNGINRVRLLHNRAALWELVDAHAHLPANTLHAFVGHAYRVWRDLDVSFEHAQSQLTAYEQKLLIRKTKRTGSPATPADTRGFRQGLRRVYAHWHKSGRQITVDLPLPAASEREATNHIDWYLQDYLQRGQRSHIPGDAAFERSHYLGLTANDIRNLRCSHVDPLDEIAAVQLEDGRVAWLGPHMGPIEGIRNQRLESSTQTDPDPLLFPHPDDPTRTMTAEQHLDRLRRATGLNDILVAKAVATGDADLILRGVPFEYLAQCKGVGSDKTLADLEDFQERVLYWSREGLEMGLGEAEPASAPPGTIACTTCLRIVDLDALLCPFCRSPIDQGRNDKEAALRIEVHRLIDQVLALRGESDADRERLDEEERRRNANSEDGRGGPAV